MQFTNRKGNGRQKSGESEFPWLFSGALRIQTPKAGKSGRSLDFGAVVAMIVAPGPLWAVHAS